MVLVHLARYHAQKQVAADQLVEFDTTAHPATLAKARRELEAGLAEWEELVRLTDGLYPPDMRSAPMR